MNKPNIRRQLRGILFAVALIGASSALPSARADRPATASGSWTDCDIITDVRPAGPNTIVTVALTQTLTGTASGFYVGTERDVIYPDGSATFHGSGVFTGTVIMSYAGTVPSNGTGSGNWVLDEGTGGLASLHGQGTIQFHLTGPTETCDQTSAGTYTGQIQFAP